MLDNIAFALDDMNGRGLTAGSADPEGESGGRPQEGCFGPSSELLEASRGLLRACCGTLFGRLRALVARRNPLEAVLGTSGGRLEAGSSPLDPLRGLLGSLGGPRGPSWGLLGLFRGPLGSL